MSDVKRWYFPVYGQFVTAADFDALTKRFYASNRALAAAEARLAEADAQFALLEKNYGEAVETCAKHIHRVAELESMMQGAGASAALFVEQINELQARLAELEHAEHNGDIWCERASKAEARLADRDLDAECYHHLCELIRANPNAAAGEVLDWFKGDASRAEVKHE